jgi:hypothetical protein
MPISHKEKIIFIHIPKTGGGSVEKTLNIWGSDNNGSLIPDYNILYGLAENKLLHHLTFREILDLTKKKFKDYKVFSFVRNPYDKIVSEFLWRSQVYGLRKVEFKEFLNEDVIPKKNNLNKFLKNFYKDESLISLFDVHYKDQVNFLKLNEKLFIENIGKFENIKEDLQHFTGKIIIKNKIHKNKFDYFFYLYKKILPKFLTKKSYRKFYDNESYDLVSRNFEIDIKTFNYTF